MTSKIKILHLLWSGHFGGAEKFVKDIVTYSDKEHFEHTVCFLSDEAWLGEEFRRQGADVQALGMKNGTSFIQAYRFFKILKNYRPDIIHSHVRNYLVNGFVLTTKGIVKMYFEHGGDIDSPNPGKILKFYSLIAKHFDCILANSLNTRRLLIENAGVAAQKIKTHFLGIDPECYTAAISGRKTKKWMSLPETNRLAGVVCRLVEQKGLDDFIKTAAAIHEKAPDWSFIVVGDGPLMAPLKLMAAQTKANIHFLGERQDIPALMRAMDVYLMTSRSEAFGLSVLEALASGVPVFGFKVAGVSEIFERGGGGVLLDERNPSKLASVVIETVSDQTCYDKLVKEGVLNVKDHFDIRHSIRNLEEIYIMSIKK